MPLFAHIELATDGRVISTLGYWLTLISWTDTVQYVVRSGMFIHADHASVLDPEHGS